MLFNEFGVSIINYFCMSLKFFNIFIHINKYLILKYSVLIYQITYSWEAADHGVIRKNFEQRASKLYRNMMFNARKSRPNKPGWCGEADWIELQRIFDSPEFQEKARKNSENRRAAIGQTGYPLHTGGSITHLTHRQRLVRI